MVAFSGADPIGVLIGAKRPSATLIHRIAVHPDHVRQGHGRHMLASLSSKLAILGPPRLIAEVPEALPAGAALFAAAGYVPEAVLTDYLWQVDTRAANEAGEVAGGFVIPVTVDDLAANGLLGDPTSPLASSGQGHPPTCWERSVETLTARKDEITGLAVASDERLEAYILYIEPGEIVLLRCSIEDGGARLRLLLSRLGGGTFRFPKVHPTEVSAESLETLGFRPAGGHVLYAARARSA